MRAFPELRGPRLLLRQPEAHDAQMLRELLLDPDEGHWLGDVPLEPRDIPAKLAAQERAYHSGTALYWSIELRSERTSTPGAVGFVALHNTNTDTPTLSYGVRRPLRRRGIAREAIIAVLRYAKTSLATARVLARTHQENTASWGLLLALGFSDRDLTDTALESAGLERGGITHRYRELALTL